MSEGIKFADSIEKIWVVPGFHSDVVWIEDQRDYAIILIGDVDQNLKLCKADPDYGVFLHELTYLRPYFDTYPENRDFLRELIRQGRVGTGGSHSQPAETLIGPEGLVRNIIYGRLFHEGVLGDRPEIYMPWDVFGHSAQLGQVLRKSRFVGCIWSKDIRGAQPVFWHVSLDGSRLLFKRMGYGMAGSGFEEQFMELLASRSHEIASLGLTQDVRLDATDFKPPSAWLAGRSGELKRRNPRIIISGTGHEAWFHRALEEIEEKGLAIPVTARDFEWHHQGTGVSRIEFKISNRMGENMLLNAEKFATIASYLGAKYPDKALDKGWRQLLFNQHHDAITGPLCDRSYLDLMLGYREALELGQEVLGNSLDYIGKYIDTARRSDAEVKGPGIGAPLPDMARPIPFAVFNPLNWRRDDVVRVRLRFEEPVEGFTITDYSGNEVAFEILESKRDKGRIAEVEALLLAKGVPGIGYKLFYAIPGRSLPCEPERYEGNTIENEFFRITVDPELGGGITSIYDKTLGRELIDREKGPGNELVALAEDPDRREPAWEVFTTGEKVFSRDYPARVMVQTGPLMSKLIVEGDMKDSMRRQEIILYKGIRRIEFKTRLERYSGAHDLYVVTFPAALRGLEPVFEERFGATMKRKSKGRLDFRTWQWRNFSDCGARRCYQWFGLGQSGIIKCGKPGASDHTEVAIGMVGLVTGHDRAVVECAYRLQDALIRRGIPVTPFFDDLDADRRQPLPAQDSCMPREDLNEDLPWGTSFRIALDVDGDNSYFGKVFGTLPEDKKAYYRDEMARYGFACLLTQDRDVPEGWPALPVLLMGARSPDTLSRGIDRLLEGLSRGHLTLPGAANATGESASVDSCGLILANVGNVLGSVECDDTLVLFLMHTAAWGGVPWGKDRLPYMFVPEWKTHEFLYALYPHEGDWRSAKAYRFGYEYNNPLVARALDTHGGELPCELSFVEVEGESLVVTSMKPLGFGAGALSSYEMDSKRGIILRAYEATGSVTPGGVRFFRPLTRAYRTNLLEEEDGEIALHDGHAFAYEFGPFGIETFCMVPTVLDSKPGDGIRLGREKEIAQPVYFKYWQHNVGADPIGYCPVGVSLRGDVKTGVHIRQGGITVNAIQVSVVNDYVDRTVNGEVKIVAPDTWRAYPDVIEYNLGPGEHLTREVILTFITDGKLRYRPQQEKGIVRARLVHDGQVIEDILEVGGESLLDWDVNLDAVTGEIVATLRNPNADDISGELFIASPMELWPGELVGEISLGKVVPRSRGFTVKGNGSLELRFEIRPGRVDPAEAWAIAKIAYHGKVEYKPVFGNAVRYV